MVFVIGAMLSQSLQRRQSCLAVELLSSLVESNALGSTVHDAEPGDSELLAGLHDSCYPSAFQGLSLRVLLLGHHLASFVKHQVGFCEAPLRELRGSIPDLAVGSGLHCPSNLFRLFDLGATYGLF